MADGVVFLPVGLVSLVAYADPVPVVLRAAWCVIASFASLAYSGRAIRNE
jgi:hypothetical protein